MSSLKKVLFTLALAVLCRAFAAQAAEPSHAHQPVARHASASHDKDTVRPWRNLHRNGHTIYHAPELARPHLQLSPAWHEVLHGGDNSH